MKTAPSVAVTPDYDVIIVGGGITGLSTAVTLLQQENKPSNNGSNDNLNNIERISPERICILEKSSGIRPVGATIGLFPNGVAALESISPQLAREVCASGVPYKGVIRHKLISGKVTTVETITKSVEAKGTYSVAWYILQQSLYNRIPQNDLIQFGKEVENISMNNDNSGYNDNESLIKVTYRDKNTNQVNQKTCRIVIGADGIHSVVRKNIFPEYKQLYTKKNDLNRKLFRAIISKEKLLENTATMPPNMEEIIPTPGYSNTYTCAESDRLFGMRQLAEDIYSFTSSINGTFAKELMPGKSSNAKYQRLCYCYQDFPLPVQHWIQAVDKEAIYENDVFDFDVLPKWSKGNCVLIGDASHGISPALGQGANVGLEDAAELGKLLRMYLLEKKQCSNSSDKQSIQALLESFERIRIDRVCRIHEMSRQKRNGNGLDPSFRSWIYSWKPQS